MGERILRKEGAGGRAMRRLIESIFVEALATEVDGIGLAALDDGAAIRVGDRHLVITTDSHVVKPLFFAGGDIGRLSVAGTVNDLAMMGCTTPTALTCAAIVEEGFGREELRRVFRSIRETADEAGVAVVTGDTKVMGRGELDGIALNSAGVGFTERPIGSGGLRPGDAILVSGTVGDHGFTILAARQDLRLEGALRSDVAPLNGLVAAALEAGGADVVALKDPTRGGLASALHELAGRSGVGILLREREVPVRYEVRAAAELLGIDPLVAANEGKAVIGVRARAAEKVLAALRGHPLGREAAIVATCIAERPGDVILDTGFGKRLLAEIEGDPMPRIC